MKSVVERKKYMVQPIDFNRPIYSAVNINIRKPEVDTKTSTNPLTISNDNGIYNAVKINIDNPKINNDDSHKIYDYPEASGIVTYDMLSINPVTLPEGEKTEPEPKGKDRRGFFRISGGDDSGRTLL